MNASKLHVVIRIKVYIRDQSVAQGSRTTAPPNLSLLARTVAQQEDLP